MISQFGHFLGTSLGDNYFIQKHYLDPITNTYIDENSEKIIQAKSEAHLQNKYLINKEAKKIHRYDTNNLNKIEVASIEDEKIFDVVSMNEFQNVYLAYRIDLRFDHLGKPQNIYDIIFCTLKPFTIVHHLASPTPYEAVSAAINDAATTIFIIRNNKITKFTATGATMPLEFTKARIEKLQNAYFIFKRESK